MENPPFDPHPSISHIFLYGVVFAFIIMTLFWVWGRIRNNYGVIDVGWGVLNSGLLWLYFLVSGSASHFWLEISNTNLMEDLDPLFQTEFVLTILMTLWGLRLSVYLLMTRILPGHPEDKRYHAFRKDYGDKVHRKFFTNVFMFQGLLALVLTAPYVSVYLKSHALGFFGYVGIVVFLIGIVGETLADWQLSHFLKKPENKGKVCNIGFWYYSRHPNYFFEWVIWLGASLVAVEVSWFGILPAIFMYILLVYFSGIPFAEKSSLQSRGEEYRKYQETTNAFFPWFPKKNPQ